jgi:uncharacterized protein YacL (UPF0231 family)
VAFDKIITVSMNLHRIIREHLWRGKMNFNEEIEGELRDLNLGGKVVAIRSEDRGTPKDWATLERKIALRVHENEIMMTQSELNAARSALC